MVRQKVSDRVSLKLARKNLWASSFNGREPRRSFPFNQRPRRMVASETERRQKDEEGNKSGGRTSVSFGLIGQVAKLLTPHTQGTEVTS
eukprot:scaffold45662_cov73-Cyclotella_meneghiniana.AAC.8